MDERDLPIDRGWAWVILFAVTTTNFLYVGTYKSFGIFFVDILEEFQESVSVTSLISGIQSGVYCIASLPLLLCLMNKVGARKCVIVGSILISLGYAISAVAENVNFLYFSISLVVGLGSAFLYAPALVILGQYFDKRRGVATGIAISGGCLGSLVLPPFYRFLLDSYGLRGALLFTSGMLFNNTAMGCLLRPLEFYRRKENKTLLIQQSGEMSDCCESSHKENKTLFLQQNGKMSDYCDTGPIVNGLKKDPEYIISGPTSKSIIDNLNKPYLTTEQFSGSQPIISKSSPMVKRSVQNRKRTRAISEMEDCPSESMGSKLSLSSFYKYISIDDIASMSIVSIKEVKPETIDSESENEESRDSKCSVLNFSLFRNSAYVLFVIVHMLGTLAPAVIPAFLPAYYQENGVSKQEIVILVAILGASDFVGRILCGYLSDKPWIKKHQIIMGTQLIAGLIVNCSSLFTKFWSLALFSALFGISAGGIFALVVPILAEIIGMDHFKSAFAFLIITQGPVVSTASPLFGYFRDLTGDYSVSFHFLGSTSLLAGILLFIESFRHRCKVVATDDDEIFSVVEKESLT